MPGRVVNPQRFNSERMGYRIVLTGGGLVSRRSTRSSAAQVPLHIRSEESDGESMREDDSVGRLLRKLLMPQSQFRGCSWEWSLLRQRCRAQRVALPESARAATPSVIHRVPTSHLQPRSNTASAVRNVVGSPRHLRPRQHREEQVGDGRNQNGRSFDQSTRGAELVDFGHCRRFGDSERVQVLLQRDP